MVAATRTDSKQEESPLDFFYNSFVGRYNSYTIKFTVLKYTIQWSDSILTIPGKWQYCTQILKCCKYKQKQKGRENSGWWTCAVGRFLDIDKSCRGNGLCERKGLNISKP